MAGAMVHLGVSIVVLLMVVVVVSSQATLYPQPPGPYVSPPPPPPPPDVPSPPPPDVPSPPPPFDDVPSPPPPEVPSPPPPVAEVRPPPPTLPIHHYYPSLSPPFEVLPSPPPPPSTPTATPPPPSDPETPPKDTGPYNRAPPGSPPDIYNPPSLFPGPSDQSPPWYIIPPSGEYDPPPPPNFYPGPENFDPDYYTPPKRRHHTPPRPPGPPGKVRCLNKNYGNCHMIEHVCPRYCPGGYCEVDCFTCTPVCNCDRPGAVCEDPRFVGADGLAFYFHGKKEKDFCIVSDANLHINAHFIGKRSPNMKRDFTWVQSLGILFDEHQLYIAAEKTSTWDDSIDRLALKFNGESISLHTHWGAKWQPTNAPKVSITRPRDTNAVVIEVEGNFQIKATAVPITEKDSKIHNYGITSDDCFAHLDLSFKFYSLGGDVNGVLGQTYASNYESKVKLGVLMSVLGGEKEFASSNLFSTDCAASRFNGRLNSSEKTGYGSLSCSSGMDGKGVVCKR